MIPQETTAFSHLYLTQSENDQYDAFFGSKKKRQERRARRKARKAARALDPKIIARKAKRKKFFKGLGDIYDDLGGATGIGTAIDAITKPKKNDDMTTGEEQDAVNYSYGLKKEEQDRESEKGMPMGVYLVGGVVFLSFVTLGVMYYKDKQQIG